MLAIGQSAGILLPQRAAAVHNAGLHCTSPHLCAHLLLSAATYRGLILDSLGGLPGLIIGLLIIDCLGRLSSLGWMQALALVTWVPLLGMSDSGAGGAWLTSVAFVAQWWYTAALTVNNVWQVEVFPTASRSLCVALNGIMGNLGNVIAPYVTAVLVQEYARPRIVVAILAALAALGVMLSLLALGRRLETGHHAEQLARVSSRRLYHVVGAPFGSQNSASGLHVVAGVLDGVRERGAQDACEGNDEGDGGEGSREGGGNSDALSARNGARLRDPLLPTESTMV